MRYGYLVGETKEENHSPIFRQGVLTVLSTMARCEIIGQPTSMSEALELARTEKPDVAVLDTCSTTIDPFELVQRLRTCSPGIAVLMLSDLEDEAWLFQAIKVGAAAYATRTITAENLVEMVHRISQGEYLITDEVLSRPRLVRRVFQSCSDMARGAHEDPQALKPSPLSSRETEILASIALGNWS